MPRSNRYILPGYLNPSLVECLGLNPLHGSSSTSSCGLNTRFPFAHIYDEAIRLIDTPPTTLLHLSPALWSLA
jgi:hypothetical protein